MFGGSGHSGKLGDTWEWDGQVWAQMLPVNSPSPRSGHAMVFNLARGCVFLFGGQDLSGADLNDTWEWNGRNWALLSPVTSPPARAGHAMAYDVMRQRVVMFGGVVSQRNTLEDTWEWVGSTWVQRSPASKPQKRHRHSMAYDFIAQRTVLYGGEFPHPFSPPSHSDETWLWDGTNWIQSHPQNDPGWRGGQAMEYDFGRRRVVMHGGQTEVPGHERSDTWEWDGLDWQLLGTGSRLALMRVEHALAFDVTVGRLTMFGGDSPWGLFADTEHWDGADWQKVADEQPIARSGCAMAFDATRGRALMFGGTPPLPADTWEWNGSRWLERVAVTLPSSRYEPVLFFDSNRGRILMFGGTDINGRQLADTWEWAGSDWRLLNPMASPPGGGGWRVAFDQKRLRGVIYRDGDTWEWDGTTWNQATPVRDPGLRRYTAMAWDGIGKRVLLYGGYRSGGAGTVLGDSWAWDGQIWTPLSPQTNPPALHGHAMDWDAARRRLVLSGGRKSQGQSSDVWEWDGQTWLQRSPSGPTFESSEHASCYDRDREKVLVFGRSAANLWSYGPVAPSTYLRYGSGCAGVAGVPLLEAVSRPWIGEEFALRLSNVPQPAQPVTLLFGVSDQVWQGWGLPLDLGFLGMPGCQLQSSVDIVEPMVVAGGSASWRQHICVCPNLIGLSFYNQAIVFDAGANSFGAVLSNPAVGTFGAK